MKADATQIPTQRCWRCDYEMQAATSAVGDDKPREGDVSMCLACGAVAVFTKDLQLRKPTPSEEVEVAKHPVLTAAQIYRAGVVGDQLKPKRKRK